jgi:hypothetical protein
MLRTQSAGIFLMTLLCEGLTAGIIGNVPLDHMKKASSQIVAGLIQDVKNANGESQWSIQVVKTYKGNPASELRTVKAGRTLSSAEVNSVRMTHGIFMVDGNGNLLRRTGSVAVTDFFVPIAGQLAAAKDQETALCVDWMRGLMTPGALLLRDLAVAASYCGASKERVDAIAGVLTAPTDRDALILLLVRLPQGEPAALEALERWLSLNPTANPLWIENIAFGMFAYSSPDKNGSATLRRLAQGARSEHIREAAATVLAYIHSEETWPDLTALLDAVDPQVRRLALLGLQQTVDAAEHDQPGAFERPLIHMGETVKRAVRKRPTVPVSARVPSDLRGINEAAILGFWRQYADQHR